MQDFEGSHTSIAQTLASCDLFSLLAKEDLQTNITFTDTTFV